MNESKACLFAYKFDPTGRAEPIDPASPHDSLVWIHLDARHAGVRPLLDKIPGIDPLSASSLLAAETRPRLVKVGSGLLVILRGVNLNENARPEDMVSLRLFLDQRHIVSLRRRKSKAVDDLEAQIRTGKGPVTSGDFLSMLCTHILDRMEPLLATLDDMLDVIEEKLIKDHNAVHRTDITRIRQQAIMFRRHMAPQRDVIGQLKLLDDVWLSPDNRRVLQECHDRITRFVEEFDSLRDRSQIVHEELVTLMSEKLNRNMYTLSVIAALFLPLSFLTGLFGVNLGGMPGSDNAFAFYLFCTFLIFSVSLFVFIFRKMKWL